MKCAKCKRRGNWSTLIQDTDGRMLCDNCWWNKVNKDDRR